MTPTSTSSHSSFSDEALRAWELLAAEAGTLPTHCPAWALACEAALPGSPRLLSVASGESFDAVAPLVRLGPTLEPIGGREIAEPTDFLARSPQALAALAAMIAESGYPLIIDRIPADSATLAALREAFGRGARIIVTPKPDLPKIVLSEDWAEPGGGLSSSRRSSLRRGRRKAEKLGEIETRLLTPKPEEVGELLDQAFAIEARSWKSELGTAVLQQPKSEAFFRHYATELAAREQLRIEFLVIDGNAVAMQYAAVWRNRFWLFKIGYDAAYAAASPGQVLLSESVAAAARAGLQSYELLGSREKWTDVWTKDTVPCSEIRVLPMNPRGALAMAAIRVRTATDRGERIFKRRKLMVISRAAGRYVTGPERASGLAEVDRYEAAGYATTLGFWSDSTHPPTQTREEARASAEELPPGSEVSLKLSDMGGDGPELDELLAICSRRQLGLHLDALLSESATESQSAAKRLSQSAPGMVGCTLPGRWARSLEDARALAHSGLRVRVVKGEHEGAAEEELDPVDGSIEIVAALADGNCHVEVATQDAELARAALELLKRKGASCELQVLYGMRFEAAIEVANDLDLPVRIYVPYGASRLPYGLRSSRNTAVALATLARDLSPLPPRRPPGA